jgi:hypothetical protein
MVKIYLDAGALNRLTDDQSQSRIHTEAEAVEQVLQLVWKGEAEWKASIVLDAEIRRNPDGAGRNDALKLLSLAGEFVRPHRVSLERAGRRLGKPTVPVLNPVNWLRKRLR